MDKRSASPSNVPAWSSEKTPDSDYRTSISVARLVSAAGWVTVAVAVFVVLGAFASVGRMGALALAPSLGLVVGGFVLVIAGQSARALMDNANTSKQILKELKELTKKKAT
jgi:hypothetical protein